MNSLPTHALSQARSNDFRRQAETKVLLAAEPYRPASNATIAERRRARRFIARRLAA